MVCTRDAMYRGYDEQMYVMPMDNIKVLVDDATQSVGIVLEGQQMQTPPAIALSAGQTITLIQALRMAIRDIEMLPPPSPPTQELGASFS